MEAVFAITLGVLTASGVYLLLRARIFPVVMGLTLISYAVNLFIFAMGRLGTGVPAVIGKSAEYGDPLPQALVLTAIVIGFSLFIFALALLKRTRELHGDKTTDSVSSITEQPAPDWHDSEHEHDANGAEARR